MSDDAEILNSDYQSHFPMRERLPDLPIEKKPYPSDHRFHNPHPFNCEFLRQNVRFINEPVCTVYTTDVRQEQPAWWPSRTSKAPLKKPRYTRDTTFRRDYTHDTLTVQSQLRKGNSRFQANPNGHSALGIGKWETFYQIGFRPLIYLCMTFPEAPGFGLRFGSWEIISSPPNNF
jgi:hypothetical protein